MVDPKPDITIEVIHAIISERDRAYNQRFEAQEKAVTNALAAAEKAVTKAELAAEKRFDAVNEFRGQLKDQASNFVTRNEIDIRFRSLEEKIVAVERGRNLTEGSREGTRWLWGTLIAAATLIIAMIALKIGTR